MGNGGGRRKNLFHHLGLEGRGEGELELFRLTLEEEGGVLLGVTRGEAKEELEEGSGQLLLCSVKPHIRFGQAEPKV